MVPAAVRGPIVGPACRACASESERVRRFGGKISAGIVRCDPIYGEVGAAMTGHFKVNGVGTLWLPRNDEVMAKEVGAVMIVWELWHGTLTREAFMERDEMILVVGASMCMLVTGGNECTNSRQEYKIVYLVVM